VWSNSNFVFRQKLVGEDGSVRRSFVMVKQPGIYVYPGKCRLVNKFILTVIVGMEGVF